MYTGSILEHCGERTIIDTKFSEIETAGRFREVTLRNQYIYQIYAYLRSQERNANPLCVQSGLLHQGATVDESIVIQGHSIRFATVDHLGADAAEIRSQLLAVVE